MKHLFQDCKELREFRLLIETVKVKNITCAICSTTDVLHPGGVGSVGWSDIPCDTKLQFPIVVGAHMGGNQSMFSLIPLSVGLSVCLFPSLSFSHSLPPSLRINENISLGED